MDAMKIQKGTANDSICLTILSLRYSNIHSKKGTSLTEFIRDTIRNYEVKVAKIIFYQLILYIV